MPLLSVTQSAPLLPDGNAHDYYSVGPYWWPNPETSNGLPWIKRDGVRNYTYRGETSDNKMFYRLADASMRLSLAYYYTGESRYAEKVEQLIHYWFINEDTAMSPHLNFGQGVPGVANGRPYGIIEFRHLLAILDSVTLISNTTNKRFDDSLNAWMSDFLTWLLESPLGQEEANQHNNHGTYHDTLVAGIGVYLSKSDVVMLAIERNKARIVSQIKVNGEQPHELSRTRPFHYSAFNLLAFSQLAALATHFEEDLWRYPSDDDSRLISAINYLLANSDNKALWKGSAEQEIDMSHLVTPLMRLKGLNKTNVEPLLEHKSSQANLLFCGLFFDAHSLVPNTEVEQTFDCTL